MKTATREQTGTTIVDVTGDIDMGTSPGLRKTLLESLKKTPRLVVNMRRGAIRRQLRDCLAGGSA